jgi:2,3-bisphosphoglycerate-dependent phosphoglycerate mutase
VTTVVFVRHAHSVPSPDLPQAAFPLSQTGRRQAQDLAPVLADLGVTALASSPYIRAVGTLAPFAEASGLPIGIDDDLRERKLTDGWLPDVAAVEAAVRRMFAEPAFALPGGESARGCIARFEAAVARVVAAHPGGTIAIAAHGGVLSHVIAPHQDAPPFDFWRGMKMPHLFLFDYGAQPRWLGELTLERG